MLHLDALEVIQLFRKPGGNDFADFCNKIIYASCWSGGVPASDVATSSRTDAKDKGVDTRVNLPIPNDRSGYFDAPSIWQFKAADEANVTAAHMKGEVNKPRAKRWIEEGSAYRICICDHLTPDKKQTLLDELTGAVRAINAGAPDPRVLSVDDLVVLSNNFPALVLEYRPNAQAICILFDRWKQLVSGITAKFVPGAGFEETKAMVLNHANFGIDVRSPILALYGSAGAGKTRAAFECLKEIPVANSMVLYTSSEDDAIELAHILVNSKDARVVVVADDCSLAARERLSRLLMGVRSRVRCLCIDNSFERVSTAAPELIIPKLNSMELEKVLAANFPGISPDRLRAYSQFCDGSVRLAADMCANYDSEIAQAGSIEPALANVEAYYRVRLKNDDEREAIEAIALLKRVRHKGDEPTELKTVCDFLGVEAKTVERALSRLSDAPGWIEKGALYYRVTPDLIALIAFNSAWSRLAKGDEEGFLNRMPTAIQESFMRRASESGSPEVRDTVQRFFRRFAHDFTARDLADVHLVNRFLNLVDLDPALYLPALRRTIEGASHDDLVSGPNWTGFSWGPRRQLVWAADNFAQFEEHFADAEAVLFHLAKHECEPQIGNNATKTWQLLFRLQLSGTPLPLTRRLDLLKTRIEGASASESDLLSGAMRTILDFMGSKLAGTPVVAGKVAPPQWVPQDRSEMVESVLSALRFLNEGTQHREPGIASGAKGALLDDIEALTRGGWIDYLRPFVAASHLGEADKAVLARKLKIIRNWGKKLDDTPISPEYDAALGAWIEDLTPRSLHSRMVEAVGGGASDHFGREKEWESELDHLAAELFSESANFSAEIEWLTSAEAAGAFEFGARLGRVDREASLLSDIIERSIDREIAFVRGYVGGLVYGASINPQPVNEILDRLEPDKPLLSFQIALAGGRCLNAFGRAVRLIKESRIPVYSLRNFTYWVGNERVTNDQVLEALRVLLPLLPTDRGAADVAVDFLGARFHDGQIDALVTVEQNLVWETVAAAVKNPPRQTYWLTRVLNAIAPQNYTLAIQLACTALVGDNYQFESEAEGLLSNWATTHPDAVMSAVGALMLDEEMGWRFFATRIGLFHSIPASSVIRWLDSTANEGARKIARHLPKPFVDSSGVPQVPELTKYVLTRFEDDDRVFNEFCAGSHSFQVYVGDFASQRQQEAAKVRPFLNSPIRRIREWAQREEQSGYADADWSRERDDELEP